MSYITHFKKQPVNVQYWDYYILCRLDTDATIALQRMEYWDGTKEDGNTHAEDINDVLTQQGQQPTQDTSCWVYKSGDELLWELMGVTGERRLPKLMTFLIDDVKYLSQRNNPTNTWDRKKQYCFQRKIVQQHINYLAYIIDYFDLGMSRLTTVFYAIEMLTREKCYIDKLSVEKVLAKIEEMKNDEKLPHFLKNEIAKFVQSFSSPSFVPFRSFAEWIAQNCGMHSAEMQDRKRKNAESIPQKRGSNSIEYLHNETNIEDRHNDKSGETTQPSLSSLSLEALQAEIARRTEEQQTTKPTENVPAAPTGNPGKGKKTASPLTSGGQHMRELWEELTKRKLSLTPANVTALNGLADVVASDDDYKDTYLLMKAYPFYREKKVRIDVDFFFRKYDGWIDQVYEVRNKKPDGKDPQSQPPVVEGSTRPELRRVSGSNQNDASLNRVFIPQRNKPARNIVRIGRTERNEGNH